METKLLVIGILIGIILTFIGTLITQWFEQRRERRHELRKQKIKIYSELLTYLGHYFIEQDFFNSEIKDPKLSKAESRIRINKIFGPARLVASEKLTEKMNNLYNNLIQLHDELLKDESEQSEKFFDNIKVLGNEIIKMMREEI